MSVFAAVEAHAPQFSRCADAIWDEPELAFGEKAAADRLGRLLAAHGFAITRGIAGMPTAFVAEWASAANAPHTVAFLGEYDALPGLAQTADLGTQAAERPGAPGHGCGHHLLGAASALAAVALAETLKREGRPGRVRFYGCPAEEAGSGKVFLVRAGALDGVDAAFTWHPHVVNEVDGETSLAFVEARFRFTGRAAHAAATPHLGRSALDAVELMSVGVNYLREHMPPDARVHSAITDTGGHAPNVVQATAEVVWLIRSPASADCEDVFARVCDIARGAALMTGTTVAHAVTDAGQNILLNRALMQTMERHLHAAGAPAPTPEDLAFAAELRAKAISEADVAGSLGRRPQALREALYHTAVLPLPADDRLAFVSTDVGDVSWVVPTVQCHTACYAIGTLFHSWQMVAQGKRAQAHAGLALAAKAMAATAAECLADPGLIATARAELTERRGGRAYRSLLPAETGPALPA